MSRAWISREGCAPQWKHHVVVYFLNTVCCFGIAYVGVLNISDRVSVVVALFFCCVWVALLFVVSKAVKVVFSASDLGIAAAVLELGNRIREIFPGTGSRSRLSAI